MTTQFLLYGLLIGVGASAFMDLVAWLRNRLLGTPLPNYAPVGRWAAYFLRGHFTHNTIATAPPIDGELALGWVTHYFAGIFFAYVLLLVWGMDWAWHPTLLPALIVGIGSLVAPFFLLQPTMGFGFAASKLPNPNAARLGGFLGHLAYAVGLYVAGFITSALI